MKHKHLESGKVHGAAVAIILLTLLLSGAIVFGVWSYTQYGDYKNNFDSKLALGVSDAVKVQAEEDEAKYTELEKKPNRQFVGPEDYGRVTFDYPKTWSVYEATDITDSKGAYEAYLNPVVVPPVEVDDQKFAIRVIIEDDTIDNVLSEYDKSVEDGEIKTSAFSVNGITGTRLDGQFTDTIKGSAVVLKIRDKTLTIRTDADKAFKTDFEKIIKTINFNQ